MVEDKVLTIKYVTIESIKGKDINGVRMVPLYVQVIFVGKNTRFRVNRNGKPILVNEDFSELSELSKSENVYLSNFKDRLEKIISFEVRKFRKKFTLRGLQKRVEFYDTKIVKAFAAGQDQLDEALKSVLTYNQFIEYKSYEKSSDRLGWLNIYDQKFKADLLKSLASNPGFKGLMIAATLELLKVDRGTVYDWLFDDEDIIFKNRMKSFKKGEIVIDGKQVKLSMEQIKKLPEATEITNILTNLFVETLGELFK